MPSKFIKSVVIPLLILASSTAWLGCAAPAGEPAGSREPIAAPAPQDTLRDPNVFSVVLHTPYDLIYIDDFESEFNQRRGIRSMLGFDEEDFTSLKEIPWGQIYRADFEEVVNPAIWEQIYSGRENQELRQDQVFKILLHNRSGSTRYFYAIISKFRGYKDGVRWTLNMTGNGAGIEYIEFNP